MSDETIETAPDVTPEPAEVEVTPVDATAPDAGVPDGTVEKTDAAVPEIVRERIEYAEKVVFDFDADGNHVGWHKEAV